MKRTIIFLVSFLPIGAHAQKTTSISAINLAKDAQEVTFNKRTNTPSFIKFKDNRGFKTTDFTQWAAMQYEMRASDQLKLISTSNPDELGRIRYRYQQEYKGIPVEGAVLNVHEKDGKVIAVNGDYYHTITPINTIRVQSANGVELAKNYIGAEQYKWENKLEESQIRASLNKPDFTFNPIAKLILMPTIEGGKQVHRYVYKIDVYAQKPLGRWDIYIDAETGTVLNKVSKLCSADVKGTAVTKYHGTHQITTDSISPNQFLLRQKNRKGFGQHIEALNCQQQYESSAVSFTDADNLWDNVNPLMDEAATDAFWGAEATYDYYLERFNRKSFDNNGAKMLMYLHYNVNFFNAFWNGDYTVFGDGENEPLTSIDVVGHEFTHAVTQYTADLNYYSESGALNESFSDIFGTAIEFYKLGGTGDASWLVGQGSFTIRSMADPNLFGDPDTYEGKYWVNTNPCNDFWDNCGVHTNSGVQNFWFYLLSEGGSGTNDHGEDYNVTAIGIDKAAQIAYRNLSTYLTPNSDYDDARWFSIQAAIDLYGEDSPESQAVQNAWHAVGLGKPYSFLPVSDFRFSKMVCSIDSAVKFINTSGNARSFIWSFGDGQTSTERNPEHIYANEGVYTVSLISTNLNGADTLVKESYINIANAQPIALKDCYAISHIIDKPCSINRVQLNTIDHISLVDGYMDFTCLRTNLKPGQSYPITITTNDTIPQYTRVWIDYDNSGDYSVSELVFSTNSVIKTHTGMIQIPQNATLDQPLRLRVISGEVNSWSYPDEPCWDVWNGQIEDYTVYITETTTGINKESDLKLKIYPNPTNDKFFIESLEHNEMNVSIYNMMGEMLSKQQVISGNAISLKDVPNGIYFIQVTSGSKQFVQKIVKE